MEALDDHGRLVSPANLPVEFEVSGPGGTIGLAHGEPNLHELEKGNHRSIFNGLAQVIVQCQSDGVGPLVLRA